MPLAMRNENQFAFPERVLGPVQEHRRMIAGNGWAEEFFEGSGPMPPQRRGSAFMPPAQRLPYQKGPMMAPPPAYADEFDYDYDRNYDYDYEEEYMAPPPPPPAMMRGPRGPMRPPMMGQRGGYFKSMGGPMGFEETRFRATPPPPALIEETRFRRSPIPPSPVLEETTVFRGSPPPPVAFAGRRGMVGGVRGFAAAAAATTTVVGQRALAAEVISEEITSVRPIGYEVWEEQIEVPVVTPIMQTVVRQDPMLVEKRITQEVVAPMVVQEQGMAAAATVVESATAAPTVVREMGMTAAPTVVQEMGMMAPPTVVQEGYAAAAATVSTAVVEPRLMAEWETRAPTVVREMDATLPPIAAGGIGIEQGPIVVDEAPPMPVGVGVATTTMTTTGYGAPMMNNYGGVSTFEQGMGMPGGIGAAPVPANMGPPPVGVNTNAFGGPADLNNLGEPRARGLKRLRQKMHRHH